MVDLHQQHGFLGLKFPAADGLAGHHLLLAGQRVLKADALLFLLQQADLGVAGLCGQLVALQGQLLDQLLPVIDGPVALANLGLELLDVVAQPAGLDLEPLVLRLRVLVDLSVLVDLIGILLGPELGLIS